jgi:cytochrome P450
MLFFDAPERTRLRKLMNKGFSPAAIESLRPQVEKLVERLLSPLRRNRQIDLLPQFAHPLPAYVIAEILDVPESLHQLFIHWSNAIATLFGNPYRTVDHLDAEQENEWCRRRESNDTRPLILRNLLQTYERKNRTTRCMPASYVQNHVHEIGRCGVAQIHAPNDIRVRDMRYNPTTEKRHSTVDSSPAHVS